MRAGAVLFLCSVGLVTGGACSARSLLTIKLKADGLASGERLRHPVIDVVRSDTGTSVKRVDRSEGGVDDLILILDDTMPSLLVGVYLPSDFEGDVRVNATFTDGVCQWTGNSQDVPVQAGQNALTSVQMMPGDNCRPAPTADGGTSDANNDGPTFAGDTQTNGDGAEASDAASPPIKCGEYCMAFQNACGGNGQDLMSCLRICQNSQWPQGKHASPPADTFYCRWDHLQVVTNDAALGCSECFAASPESPGICGPVADAGARDACPPTD